VKRIVWLTDIHLNFVESAIVDQLLADIAAESPDAVLIGGDVGESPNVADYLSRIVSDVERPVYFVLGNHDFYRSSIPAVRESMRELCDGHGHLCYLTQSEPIALTSSVGLVGHDGWADARSGDYENSDVFLSDYALIAELAGHYDVDRRPTLTRLGDEAAHHIRDVLPIALEQFEQVFLLTHVPPLREACWHEGRVSDDNWAPHFVCQVMGETILEIMRNRPDRKLTVLCGHTHGAGEARPLENVHIITGGAVYGRPAITRIFELD
jgi:predicted MPP superfamily phosphohydrolase